MAKPAKQSESIMVKLSLQPSKAVFTSCRSCLYSISGKEYILAIFSHISPYFDPKVAKSCKDNLSKNGHILAISSHILPYFAIFCHIVVHATPAIFLTPPRRGGQNMAGGTTRRNTPVTLKFLLNSLKFSPLVFKFRYLAGMVKALLVAFKSAFTNLNEA